MDYKSLGHRIRKCRIEKHLTQEKLAEMAGISLSFLGHIERGTRKASLETIVSLSNSLEISIDYLLGRTPSEFSLTASHAPEYEKIIESQSPERKKKLTEIIKILADMSDTQLENTLGFFGAAQSYNNIKKDKSIF